MKESIRKEGLKTILLGGLAVTVFGGVFIATNNYALAASHNKNISVPTSYQDSNGSAKTSIDYVKANYKVVQNKVMTCTNSNAISVNDAAEMGAQYLWDMFKVDLTGKTIYMSFTVNPSTGIAHWNGDIFDNENQISETMPEYGFTIEAISGARDSAQYNLSDKIVYKGQKTIQYKQSEADSYYKANCDEFLKLAKNFAEKNMKSKPVSAEFVNTSASLAPGYTFEVPEGKTTTFAVADGQIEDRGLIKVSPYGKFEASYVAVNILVKDANGNKTNVSIDATNKTLISINNVYTGIDYDPGSIG